jgi:hypothetical protein
MLTRMVKASTRMREKESLPVPGDRAKHVTIGYSTRRSATRPYLGNSSYEAEKAPGKEIASSTLHNSFL